MLPGFASLGLSLLQGWTSRGLAQAQNTVAQAQAKADNVIREGKNVERGAVTALQLKLTEINNARRMRAAGQQFDAAQRTVLRLQDSFTSGDLENQIANAEAAGAYAANAAQSGTAGASIDTIDAAMRLRQARAAEYRTRNNGYVTADGLAQLAGIVPQGIEGLDLGQAVAGVDYTQTLPQTRPVQGNWALDVAQWMTKLDNREGLRSDVQKASAWFNPPDYLSNSTIYPTPTVDYLRNNPFAANDL